MTVRFFYPAVQILSNKASSGCFLYYFSVYVKSFKELFLRKSGYAQQSKQASLYSLALTFFSRSREVYFSKASAKVLTIFQTRKSFDEKVLNLTVI